MTASMIVVLTVVFNFGAQKNSINRNNLTSSMVQRKRLIQDNMKNEIQGPERICKG